MTDNELSEYLKNELALQEVHVKSDGSHYNIIAVSDKFESMSRVKRQQYVYALLNDKIADGSIHAVSIKTFSEAKWEKDKLFNLPM